MEFSFTVQRGVDANLIRACSPHQITVHDQILRHSLLLSVDRILDWPPQSIAALNLEHLDAALQLSPEVILLGTGRRQQFPDVKVLSAAQRAGVGVEVMDTPAACRTYNILLQEGRRVVAALILEPLDSG